MNKYKKKQPGKLHSETLELLKNRPRILTYDAISEATGIEAGWLRNFATNPNCDPSVNRVEILNAFLKS
jgi:hypothetical protein